MTARIAPSNPRTPSGVRGWTSQLPASAPQRTIRPRRTETTMADGTEDDPWVLTTAPGTSRYTIFRDETADPPALVCTVGSTTLRYHLSAVEDLHAWLRTQPDWVPLGA